MEHLDKRQDDAVWWPIERTPKVFTGLFQSPDYSRVQNFLLQDEQTAITPQVRAIADLANDNKDFSTLAEIFALLKAAERRGRAMSVSGRKHTNTASQILSAVRVSGCTDCAIAFATLARAKGIPALVVDSARKEWIDGGVSRENGEGHFFVEVYIGDRWHLVDPVRGLLYRNDGTPKGYNPENWNLPGGYLAFAKALSVVDMAVVEPSHSQFQCVAFMKGPAVSYRDPECVAEDLKDKVLWASMALKMGGFTLLPDRDGIDIKRAPGVRVIPLAAADVVEARLTRFGTEGKDLPKSQRPGMLHRLEAQGLNY